MDFKTKLIRNKINHLKCNRDYSFTLNGKWFYKHIEQPDAELICLDLGDGVFRNYEKKWLALIAHYELDYSANNLLKVRFVETDSKVLKVKCGYRIYFIDKISDRCPEGFYRIPGYNNYAINAEGKILNVTNGNILKEKIDPNGYITVSIYDPDKKAFISARKHVCLARVFIDNPNFKEFVNHIDGDKQNNSLTNLEWATAKENSEHAARLNLILNSVKCKLRDIYTDEIFDFYNISQAAVFLKYGDSLPYSVKYVNGKKVPLLLRKRYELKLENEFDQPWFYKPNDDLKIDSKGPFEIKNIQSNEIKVFNTLKEIAKFIGVNDGRVNTANLTNGKRELNGWLIRPISNDPWPENYRNTRDISGKVFTIFNINTRIAEQVNSKLALSKRLRVDKSTISKRAIDGKLINNEWVVFKMPIDKFSPDILSPRPPLIDGETLQGFVHQANTEM